MNRKVLTFLLLFIIITTSLSLAEEVEKEKDSFGKITTLITLPESDIIYIVLSFKTGTVRDPEGKEGLNYVTAGLIEDNIKKGLNEKALTSGAGVSRQVDKEITTFFFKVHKDKFDITYPIFISEVISPDINENSLERAIDSALNIREDLINHGESLSLEALDLFIYRNHPYGIPDFGTKLSLKNINIEDIKSFHSGFYTFENYELGIGCKNPKKILERVKKDLSSLPAGKPEEVVIKEPEKFNGNKVLIIKKDDATTAIALGFPLDITRSDSDYYPLLLANSYFGHHRYMQGYLFIHLRSARGFNYGDYSYIEKFVEGDQDKMPQTRIPRQKQYFYIWIRNLSNENACFATKFTIYSLEKMIKKGLSPEIFRLNRDFIWHNAKLWDFDILQKLGFSMDSDFYHTPYFIDYIEKMIKDIKNKDVTEALQRRLGGRNIKMVFVTGEPQKLKEQLLGKKDCKPVYETTLSEEDQKIDEIVLKYNLKLRPEDIEIIEVEDIFK